MPTKRNGAGKQQEYIPAGYGDPSGEYGTNAGTLAGRNIVCPFKKCHCAF